MKYVIDGYNLLHASPLMQAGSGLKWLEKQRFRLLQALATRIPSADLAQTIVVFDARESPRGIPSEYEFEGIAVRFARDHTEADDLIEELIANHAATSSLTVVSSDVRLQKAAKRRKAAYCDSRVWFDSLQESVSSPPNQLEFSDPEAKKEEKLDPTEVAEWVAQMAIDLPEVAPKKKHR